MSVSNALRCIVVALTLVATLGCGGTDEDQYGTG